MLVGHFAVGFLTKRFEPTLSLGTLVLAAMLPDLLWPLFTLAGLEHVNFGSGRGAGNYFEAVNIAMSHSLLLGVVWGGLFALAYTFIRGSARGAWVLTALVLSHWVLDVVSHRPDMPLAPATTPRLGLGLWTSVPLTIALEGGFWLIALVAYARATRAKTRAEDYVLWIAVLLLTLVWYNNVAGPPPPNPETAPIGSLVLFSLVVLWAYWINRLRPIRQA
jgi:hypothetical protein